LARFVVTSKVLGATEVGRLTTRLASGCL
jgi:hypothetical protein